MALSIYLDIIRILGIETFGYKGRIENITLNILPFPLSTPEVFGSIQRIIQNHRDVRVFENNCRIVVDGRLCPTHTSCLLFAIDMIADIHGIGDVFIQRDTDQDFYVVEIVGFTTEYPFSIKNSHGSLIRMDSGKIALYIAREIPVKAL